MRALFLIPGDGVSQLQALPAAAATAEQLGFALQVACPPAFASLWTLLPAVEKVIPFNPQDASLADWTNLLGCVREPDFQVCVNLGPSRAMDLVLAMSHIPTRIASSGFSATSRVTAPAGGWPAQALAAWLRPIGVSLNAADFRLSLPAAVLQQVAEQLPPGDGPLLLLAPAGHAADWPAAQWQTLAPRILPTLPNLRTLQLQAGAGMGLRERAALVASSDVVLASDPLTIELALLSGVPLVALGREAASLPTRADVKGVAPATGLGQLEPAVVLQALGLG